MTGDEYDVVIAGAGAGGGFAAYALTQAGLRVVLLDRGPRFDFKRDFPLRHRDWESQPDVLAAATREEDTIIRERGARIAPEDHDICSKGVELFDAGECGDSRRGAFHYPRVHGVGGNTLHYQGEAHRFPPHAFQPESLFGWGADWPFDYQALAPYYKEAEQILGVAGEPGNPFKAERGAFPNPAHQLTTRSQLVRRGAERLGWSLLPNTLALPTRSLDGRSPCQHTGGCGLGCPFGAKSSTDLTAIARAERTGRLTLISKARLVNIETDGNARITGFVYRHDKALKRARGRRYILALGAIETPRILMASAATGHPEGIGNANGLVGRYLMDTVFMALPVEAPFPVASYMGPPLDARIWDFNRPTASGDVHTGYTIVPVGGLRDNPPVRYASRTPGFGLEHKEKMRAGYGTRFIIHAIAEQEPRYENHLALAEEHDGEGVPRVKVNIDYSPLDKAALRAMRERCRELIDAAGLTHTGQYHSSYTHPASSHVAGGCRMGKEPQTAVTDPHGRLYGTDNLFIVDASVLVSQGAGDSPSLTIQALALRTARHITAAGD